MLRDTQSRVARRDRCESKSLRTDTPTERTTLAVDDVLIIPDDRHRALAIALSVTSENQPSCFVAALRRRPA